MLNLACKNIIFASDFGITQSFKVSTPSTFVLVHAHGTNYRFCTRTRRNNRSYGFAPHSYVHKPFYYTRDYFFSTGYGLLNNIVLVYSITVYANLKVVL